MLWNNILNQNIKDGPYIRIWDTTLFQDSLWRISWWKPIFGDANVVCFAQYVAGDRDDRDGERSEKVGQPAAKAWRKDIVISTRFDISDYWTFKLEGHYMNGLEGVTIGLSDDPSEDWFLFAAKISFTF